MKSFFHFLKGLLFVVMPSLVYGQSAKDTLFLTSSVKAAKSIYEKQMAGEGALFNGVQYKALILHSYDEGHPFFLSDDWITGTIRYDGISFDSVDLQYDLVNQKVVLDHPTSHFRLELIKEKITTFSLLNHKVVRLVVDESMQHIKSGYYELLYDGNVKVYAAHKKNRLEKYENDQVKQVFDQKTQYYIFKDNFYYPVKTKGSVVKIFNNKKVMLRKYLNKNKIKFRRNPASAITKAARYYEESDMQP